LITRRLIERGLRDEPLTRRYAGRDFRLAVLHGNVITKLIA